MNRRRFAKLAALSSLGLGSKKAHAQHHRPVWTRPLSVHLFSKHLQFLEYPQMAKVAADLGFDGVDLTVRPGGHVEPEKVEEDLPKAVEALSDRGLLSIMMTTAVTNATNPLNLDVINTAVNQGLRYYRMGYYKFEEDKTWKENLDRCKKDIEGLSELHEEHGIHGAYQNHSGTGVGAYITDIVYLLEGLNPLWTGCQYDIRHAVVEGGRAWGNGVKWLKDSMSTIAVKDFTWAKHPQSGKYSVMNTPIGEGMVDFVGYFKLLRQLEIHPVVTLHCEYDLGGANRGNRELSIPKKQVYKAIKKDLTVLRDLWQKSAEV
ncbi:MAG: endonuclease [Opitutaceae bacterium]|nr:endonuclease [Opitutaceae bacterium]|tara:strand:- start:2364 stop:3317 length:954 start_codon:yes stop_codon:yes gene_type:complete